MRGAAGELSDDFCGGVDEAFCRKHSGRCDRARVPKAGLIEAYDSVAASEMRHPCTPCFGAFGKAVDHHHALRRGPRIRPVVDLVAETRFVRQGEKRHERSARAARMPIDEA